MTIENYFTENQVIDSVDSMNHNNVMGVSASSANITSNLVAGPNIEFGRKCLSFTPHHIQCLCEALQQKGDVEKLEKFLCNLPTDEMLRPNDSILR